MTKANPHLPYNAEAEEAVIGSVLIDPRHLDTLSLRPEQFFIVKNRWVWEAFEAIRVSAGAIDYLTVTSQLESNGRLAEVGGPAFLAGLLNATPNAFNAPTYAEIIRQSAERREIMLAAEELYHAVRYAETPEDVAEARKNALTLLVNSTHTPGAAEHVKRFASDLWDEVSARAANPREVFGIPTGFADWDKISGGIHQGEVLLLAGEPGIGKSLLFAQLCFQMAGLRLLPPPAPVETHPGVIYEMEMGGVQIVRRVASAVSKIATRQFRTGNMADTDWPQLAGAINAIDSLPLYLSDKTHWTTTSLRADLTRLVSSVGVEWFMVDYMNLLRDRHGKDDTERIAFVSQELHNIAKDLHLAGLAVQRLNKTGLAAAVPKLEHMSGSSQVPYDADTVLFLTEHLSRSGEKSDPNLRTLTFGKIREDEPARQFHLLKLGGLPAFATVTRDNLDGAPVFGGNGRGAYIMD